MKASHQKEIADRVAQLRREKSARERRDVFQQEIAEAIGLSPVTYGRYESGQRKIPEEVIQALAVYYGTTPPFIRYGVQPSGDEPIYLGRVPDDEAEAASRARAAKLAAQREAARPAVVPTPPRARKVAGGKRGRRNPRDDR